MNKRKSDKWMIAIPVTLAAASLGISAAIWIPAINDCNARHGELVTNAFNWPVCIASAPEVGR